MTGADHRASGSPTVTKRVVTGVYGSTVRIEPPLRRRLPLSAALVVIMVVWLASPLIWLFAVGQVSPHSGIEPTPEQERTLLVVNVCTLAYVLIAPAVVLWVAWRTRRVVLGWLTAATVVISVTIGAVFIVAVS